MCKRAVILAGGKGTRLKPYTVVLPKPLMPIGDFPILEVVIRQLAKNEFGHVTITVNHQAEIIKAFCGDGSRWGIKVDYSLESKPLSTMGPLKLIKDLPENFLVMNGDILTDLSFADFYNAHLTENNLFSISSYQRTEVSEYGVLEVDSSNRLTGFKEKPHNHYLVSMGIYMLNRRILDFIPEDTFFGFDMLMHDLLSKGEKVAVKPYDGYWLDIGRPDDYMQAIEEFDANKDKFL
mgnify:CR=1 FL=1|jgi:Nucleoside-diphosphate-sugar pyrophosphorylase involved in lipopolysaccharide biosynthesis/translation initiation factor 2B, gamma/epsilon subunits (eIF-2Bgamma/eIF-2Bepsilon)